MADWARIVNTTIKEYIRDVEPNVLRNRKVTAMLRAKGRITFNHSGDGMDWKVQFKRSPLSGYADTDTLTFSRINRWKTAQLDWRGYALTDSMTKQERLKNKGTEAIVKIYDNIARNLMDDIEDQFGDEFYIDGSAAGNSKRFHGIESIFGTGGSVTLGQPVSSPSKTYANLAIDLANQGGSWTTVGTNVQWPVGVGDAHYDYWTPLQVDYTNANVTNLSTGVQGWSAATKTWANTCIEALRYGIIHSRKNKTKKGMIDFIMLNDELFRQFLMAEDPKERIVIEKGDPDGLVALGFKDVVNFNGCDITYEYGMPLNTGYGWNIDQVELRSLQGQVFVPEGPDYDIASKSWRFSVDSFGNIRINSRYLLKFFNYS